MFIFALVNIALFIAFSFIIFENLKIVIESKSKDSNQKNILTIGLLLLLSLSFIVIPSFIMFIVELVTIVYFIVLKKQKFI